MNKPLLRRLLALCFGSSFHLAYYSTLYYSNHSLSYASCISKIISVLSKKNINRLAQSTKTKTQFRIYKANPARISLITPLTMAPSDLEQLLEMGFPKERAEIAVKKSGGCKHDLNTLKYYRQADIYADSTRSTRLDREKRGQVDGANTY
jgi:hypothetical protein